MKEIIIIPHIGIGQLKLGMAPDERCAETGEDCEIRLR